MYRQDKIERSIMRREHINNYQITGMDDCQF